MIQQTRRLHRRVGRVGHVVIAPHVAVESARLDAVDPVLRGPEPFLVGEEERAVGVQAHAVGGAETGGEDLGRRAVPGSTFSSVPCWGTSAVLPWRAALA